MRAANRECCGRGQQCRGETGGRADRKTRPSVEQKEHNTVSLRIPAGHAGNPTMYYYCNRSKMSVAGPAVEGPQSCDGGGGGGGGGAVEGVEDGEEGGGGGGCCCVEMVNGKGDREIRQISNKTRLISERVSATCNAAHATRKSGTTDGAKSGKRGHHDRRGRQSAPHGQEDHGYTVVYTEGNGGIRASKLTEAGRTTTRTRMRALHKADAAVSKRRGCSFSRASKRACFSGTNAKTETVSVKNAAGNGPNLAETFREEEGSDRVDGPEMKAGVGKDKRACNTTKGRVRLYRVRSFLTGLNGNGALPYHSSQKTIPEPCDLKQPHRPTSVQKSPSEKLHQSPSETPDGGFNGPVTNGTRVEAGGTEFGTTRQVEEAQVQARKRQLQLEERTDSLWRRLHAVQVQQVERHVGQQLGDLRKATAALSATHLSRLSRSCTEALRPAEVALDSDHTASSSGGSSGSEEEEENEESTGRHGLPPHLKTG